MYGHSDATCYRDRKPYDRRARTDHQGTAQINPAPIIAGSAQMVAPPTDTNAQLLDRVRHLEAVTMTFMNSQPSGFTHDLGAVGAQSNPVRVMSNGLRGYAFVIDSGAAFHVVNERSVLQN